MSAGPAADGTALPAGEPGGEGSPLPAGEPGADGTALPAGEPGADGTALPAGEPDGGDTALPAGEPDGGDTALPAGEPDGGDSPLPAGEPGGDGSPLPAAEARTDPAAARRLVPRGTGLVGVGIVVNAGAAYGHLAAAGRSLDTVGMSGLSLLWAVAFSAGIGLFFPLEQELTRAVAARVATGESTSPLLRRGLRVAAALLAAALALIAAAHTPLTRSAFNGDASLVWALVGALTALAATHTVRGLLAGHGLFAPYAAQLSLDGVLRLALSGTLLLAGSHSPTAFALILTAGPLAATLAVLPFAVRAGDREPPAAGAGSAPVRSRPAGRDEVRRGLAPLITAAVLAQALANTPVLGAKALAPADAALITALLCALTLVRMPQFVVGALQAALLRDLAERSARGDRAGLARGVARSAGGLVALGVLCTGPAALAGPTVTERLLAAPPVLGHADFALLGLGTTGYLLAYLLGNGTLATGGQRPQLLAWAAGAAVAAGVLLLPGAPRLRVEVAYTAGSWTAAVLLAGRLAYTLRRAAGATPTRVTPCPGGAGRTTKGDSAMPDTTPSGSTPSDTVRTGTTPSSGTGPSGTPSPASGTGAGGTSAGGTGAAGTATAGYTARLLAPGGSTLRRMLPTQAPYRWNLRRLRLGRVLDVGCGVGRNLRNCDPGSVGVDHNAHSVAAARDLGLAAYTPDEFGRAAGCAPGSFDSLLCAHVLEHLDEDTGAGLLATYLPYLRPGGRAVFITPQEAGFRSDATHVRFVGFAELAAQARAAGLTVRRTYSFPLPRAAGKLFRYNEFVVLTTAPAVHPAEMASATDSATDSAPEEL